MPTAMVLVHYSNLFTSGLLSDSPIASSSNLWAFDKYSPRRGSLPVSVNSSSSSYLPRSTRPTTGYVESSRFIRQKKDEYRSFLSLDLAESQSLRSASIKGNAPMAPIPRLQRTDTPYSVVPLKARVRKSSLPRVKTPTTRSSRESLRNIPSPKPIPSAIPPALPVLSPTPRNRSLSPMRFARHPSSRPHSESTDTAPSVASISRSSVSVSTGYRREKRGDALACLEGRSNAPNRIMRVSERGNFMMMDDEDDDDDDDDAENAIVTPPDLDGDFLSSATRFALATTPDASLWDQLFESDFTRKSQPPLQSSSVTFIDPWSPLDVANFIDLHDDQDAHSISLQSVLEISCAA